MMFKILLLSLLLQYSSAWHKSNFFINSKLPKECGHAATFTPENYFEYWGFWPWLGILAYDGWGNPATWCNAILIHPQAVITSLFCIKHIPEVKLEDHLYVAFSLPGLPSFQNISVSHIHFTSTNYNTGSLAILRLTKPVIMSSRVQPICLWEENHDYSSQISSHIGMVVGADFDKLYALSDLRIYQAPVRIIDVNKCKVAEPAIFNFTKENPLCFQYYRAPITCHGFGSMVMFPRLSERGEIVWYLRSLITLRKWVCDDKIYSTTFDIADRRPWIESHFKPSTENKCGRSIGIHTQLITSGELTNRGDWPWHAGIFMDSPRSSNKTYRCGGSLISPQYVLTAGHCVIQNSNILRNSLSVKLGKHNLNVYEKDSEDIRVSEVILHENFDMSTLRNDIALLKLANNVQYNEYIQPVCMWDSENVEKQKVYNQQGKVPGWGLNELNVYPNNLYVANIPIVEDIYCYQSHAFFYDTFLTNYTFCAGYPRGNGTSVCNGDSGGGLVLPIIQADLEITWFIRGIVSLTVRRNNRNTCDPDYYAIYTDVAKYLDWISSHANLIQI